VALEHKHNTIEEFGFDHYQTWNIFDRNGDKTTRFWNPYLIRDGSIIADDIKDRYGPDVDLEVYLDFIKAWRKTTHHIRDLAFENLTLGGKPVTTADFFKTNEFVEGLSFQK
jgi:hypothetical protein